MWADPDLDEGRVVTVDRRRLELWRLTILDALESPLAFLCVPVAIVVIFGFLLPTRYHADLDAHLPKSCEADYAKAKSATDTLRIDRRYPGDRGRLTCGAFRQRVDLHGIH
jgi:hypothetical protein